MIQAILVTSENVVFYGEGVGTGDFADRIFGGAFGWGLDKNIRLYRSCYAKILLNLVFIA
jgi:uncharacterized protein (DUF2235 family)